MQQFKLIDARPPVIAISFVGASEMARLNYRYRQKKGPTDILSFEQPRIGEWPPYQFLGDLVLCIPQVRAQAREQRHLLRNELEVLLCHGLLHLLGFDHELGPKVGKNRGARAMAHWENKILRSKRDANGFERLGLGLPSGLIARTQVKNKKVRKNHG